MTTDKSTWKKLEMRLCKEMGGKRTPLSGSNSQHGTSADCIELDQEFEKFYFEIRLREKFSHHTMFFDDVEKPAIKENKIPILLTHKKSSKNGDLVTMKFCDFINLVKNNK